MTQLVKCPTLSQVMISQFVGSSPHWAGCCQHRPVLDPLSSSLSTPPLPMLSLSKIKEKLKKTKTIHSCCILSLTASFCPIPSQWTDVDHLLLLHLQHFSSWHVIYAPSNSSSISHPSVLFYILHQCLWF